MRIDVTAQDIKYGISYSFSECPVANAIKRAIPWVEAVEVDDDYVYMSIAGRGFLYESGYRLKEFVKDFDEGNSVKPTLFHILEEDMIL